MCMACQHNLDTFRRVYGGDTDDWKIDIEILARKFWLSYYRGNNTKLRLLWHCYDPSSCNSRLQAFKYWHNYNRGNSRCYNTRLKVLQHYDGPSSLASRLLAGH